MCRYPMEPVPGSQGLTTVTLAGRERAECSSGTSHGMTRYNGGLSPGTRVQ